jgi:hypothetical protein
MKPIDKKMLDDVDILPAKNDKAQEMSEYTFRDPHHWNAFTGIVTAIVGGHGLAKNAPNKVIYDAFEAIGFYIKGA